jgi:hypothetical protein
MTDVQMFTLAMAVIIPLSLLIYSNSRVTEAKETLRAEIKTLSVELAESEDTLRAETKALGFELRGEMRMLGSELRGEIRALSVEVAESKATLRAEMKALGADVNAGFARMSMEIQSLKADLKVHELEHHK